jgi:hypothetical protein
LDILVSAWNVFVTLLPIVSALALTLGAIGGIPEIRRSINPKSFLKVRLGTVTSTAQPMGYSIGITVHNQKKILRRNMDAMSVTASIYLMDSSHQQFLGIHNANISPYLMEGAKVTQNVPFSFSFQHGQTYTIIVLIAAAGMTHYIRESLTHMA